MKNEQSVPIDLNNDAIDHARDYLKRRLCGRADRQRQVCHPERRRSTRNGIGGGLQPPATRVSGGMEGR